MHSGHSGCILELKTLYAFVVLFVSLSAASAKKFVERNAYDDLPFVRHQDGDLSMEQVLWHVTIIYLGLSRAYTIMASDELEYFRREGYSECQW